MTEHELKCWPEFYQAIKRGDKPWELRKNDRNYQVGDVLWLREWEPGSERYTGDEMRFRVPFVLYGAGDWLPEGDCIMSLAPLSSPSGDGTVAVPREPPIELLMSMAVREDHALGVPGYYDQDFFGAEKIPHADRVRIALETMRKVYEEVVGDGFYRPEHAERYRAMIGDSAPPHPTTTHKAGEADH